MNSAIINQWIRGNNLSIGTDELSFEIRASIFGKSVNERYAADFLCDNCGNYYNCPGYKEETIGAGLPCGNYYFDENIGKRDENNKR